jgi:hypothetical protein
VLLAIRRGRAEIKRGNFVTLEQLKDELAAANRKPRSKSARKNSPLEINAKSCLQWKQCGMILLVPTLKPYKRSFRPGGGESEATGDNIADIMKSVRARNAVLAAAAAGVVRTTPTTGVPARSV